MAKGSMGTTMNSIEKIRKPDRIPCDCKKCRHSKKCGSTIYCSWFDIISPNRKTCIRYLGPNVKKGKQRAPLKKKKQKNKQQDNKKSAG